MNKRTCLVMGGEAKDACAMGVLILNIVEVCPNLFDEIIIYHDGISENDKHVMSSLFPVRFIDYSFHIPFVSKVLNSSIRGFSEMVFFKYEIFKLIQEYDRVVLTDYDVLFQNNINNTFSVFNDGNWFWNDMPISTKFWKRLIYLDSRKLRDYNLNEYGINASLIVLNHDSINDTQASEIYDYLHRATIELSNCIKNPEEAILSLALQKYKIEYNTIDMEEFSYECRKGDNPAVSRMHCVGRPKFWDGFNSDVWNKRYDKWIDLGGSVYHEPLKRRLIRYTYDISIRRMVKSICSCFKPND